MEQNNIEKGSFRITSVLPYRPRTLLGCMILDVTEAEAGFMWGNGCLRAISHPEALLLGHTPLSPFIWWAVGEILPR